MRYTEDEFLDMQEIEQFGSYIEKNRAERSELIADEPLTDSATELLNLLLEIGEFYMSHEVWIYEKFDADDFGADRFEMQLAEIIECADFPQDWILEHETAIREMMLMEAFQNYGICNFSYLNPALNSKTLSEEEFIDSIQKEIKSVSRDEIKGKLIVKLIKYLRSHGSESEAANMMEKNLKYGEVCNLMIEDGRASGNAADILSALNRAIDMDKHDTEFLIGINSRTWRKERLEIYESLHDTEHLIEALKEMFCVSYDEKIVCYERLKALLSADELKVALHEMLLKKEFRLGFDASETMNIYLAEGLTDDLLRCLKLNNGFDTSELFAKYALHMSESDQTEYVQSVVKDLRQRATEPRSNRYHYWTAEMKVLKGSCEIGHQMMTALKAEFESKYGKRPAMMKWLAGV